LRIRDLDLDLAVAGLVTSLILEVKYLKKQASQTRRLSCQPTASQKFAQFQWHKQIINLSLIYF